MKNRPARSLALIGLLAAFALVTFVIESQIPSPFALPGVKLGLANIFTLVALPLLGRKEAAAVLTVRILLGSLFTGTTITLLYSLAGGVLCYVVMALVYQPLGERLTWVTSVLGALAHNLGQMATAMMVLGKNVLYYAPVLVLSGILTGLFTGLAAGFALKALKALKKDR